MPDWVRTWLKEEARVYGPVLLILFIVTFLGAL